MCNWFQSKISVAKLSLSKNPKFEVQLTLVTLSYRLTGYILCEHDIYVIM